VLAFLGALHPIVMYVLAAIGALVIGAEVVVAMTPSTDDDAKWAEIKAIPILGGFIAAFAKLAPIQKKPKAE